MRPRLRWATASEEMRPPDVGVRPRYIAAARMRQSAHLHLETKPYRPRTDGKVERVRALPHRSERSRLCKPGLFGTHVANWPNGIRPTAIAASARSPSPVPSGSIADGEAPGCPGYPDLQCARSGAEGQRRLQLGGLLAIAFGVVALVWPGIGLTTLITLFAVFALAAGLTALYGAFNAPIPRGQGAWLGVDGVLAIAVGVVVLVWPDLSARAAVRDRCVGRRLRRARACARRGRTAAQRRPVAPADAVGARLSRVRG